MDTRRGLDVIVSSLAMPAVAFAAVTVWAVTRSNPFFQQERMGLDNNPFVITKFVTMKKDNSLPTAQRITRLGRFLRATGIDEWPQFYTILKGDMSLIGPRPLPEYEDSVGRASAGDQKWNLRYQIKPGLMPPSLIHEKLEGKGYTDPNARLAYDLAYIEKRQSNQAIKEDFRLAGAALRSVFKRRIDPQAIIPLPDYPSTSLSKPSGTLALVG
jgi:lipopolysaccharide/colanic/teichoic acid biosynthesis glycosyltransferase